MLLKATSPMTTTALAIPVARIAEGSRTSNGTRAMAPTNTSSSANPGCRRLSRAGPQLQTMPPTSPRLAAMPKHCLTVGTIVTSANQSSARTEPNQVLRRRSTMTPASCCMQ